jgi:hypothetical protein
VQRGRFPTTRIQNRPKWNAYRPDEQDFAPLLANYASAKTSKTAASQSPISLGNNKNKSKTNQSQLGEEKRKAPVVDSVTISANTKGAADPLMDDATLGLVTASGDTNCEIIPAASAPTLYLTIEVGATPKDTSHQIIPVASSADERRQKITVANPPEDGTAIRKTSNDPDMTTEATSSDTTTNINTVASSATNGVGVDVTKSRKIFEHPVRHLMMDPWRCYLSHRAQLKKLIRKPVNQWTTSVVEGGIPAVKTTIINMASSPATDVGGVDMTKNKNKMSTQSTT